MTLFPTLATEVAGDSNVFRGPTGVSDAVWTISPRLDLRSNWQNDTLQFYGQLDHYAYHKNENGSRTNWMLGGLGRLDMGPGSFLSNESYYFDTHESRTSPDLSLLALSPTRYRRVHSEGMLSRQFSLFNLSAGVSYDRFDFDSTQLIVGTPINNADRDRNVFQLTGKAAYELAPDQTLFAQVTYDRREFDLLLDRNGFDRNSVVKCAGSADSASLSVTWTESKGKTADIAREEAEEEEEQAQEETSSAAFSRDSHRTAPTRARQQPSYDHKDPDSGIPPGASFADCPG